MKHMDVPIFVAGVWMTIPVKAVFAVVFSYLTHRQFLQDVANAGVLTFATTSTQLTDQKQPLWLSVHIDGTSLIRNIG
jgi:hypothetical protein